MRLGQLVQVYRNIIPIPTTLSTAFSLTKSSQLHIAPVYGDVEYSQYGTELIVSPVPCEGWRSVCRLSIRLKHKPKSLAIATRFLKEKRINILLTEACTTYQEKAHCDAICDLSYTNRYKEYNGLGKLDNPLRYN